MTDNNTDAPVTQEPPVPPQPSTRIVLPDVPREYHQFYRTPHFRWWRPLVGIVMFLAIWSVTALVMVMLGLAVSGELDLEAMQQGKLDMNTPAFFAINQICLAVAIPLAWLTHRAVFGQRIGWLSSVEGAFRWRAFWRFTGLIAPIFVVWIAITIARNGGLSALSELRILPETWFLLAVVLLVTPLQAAAEEVALRGFGTRAIGSWVPSRRLGLAIATVVTAVIFMLVHGAGDPWLNVFYVVFAVCGSCLVWRTGGLEAAIALHIVNNLTALIFLPFHGTSGLFDRQAGVADAWTLLQIAVLIGATLLMLSQAPRLDLRTSTAPAAPQIPEGSEPPAR